MIFIRSDDATDMVAAVCFTLGATFPKSRCFDQNFRPGVDEKAIVTGGLPLVPHAEGHSSTDVLLLFSREDPHELTIRSDHERWRYILAGIG